MGVVQLRELLREELHRQMLELKGQSGYFLVELLSEYGWKYGSRVLS
jgi:hypothetical protein